MPAHREDRQDKQEPPFDLSGSFAYVLAKYPVFVFTRRRAGAAAAEHNSGDEVSSSQRRRTRCSHEWYFECEGMTKLSETCSSASSSSSHVSLSLCLARAHTHTHTHTHAHTHTHTRTHTDTRTHTHTHTHLSASSALQPHTPAWATAGVSRFSDDATSDQWAPVRTVRERGENSPPISPRLYLGINTASGRGCPAARFLNEHQTKNSHQQVSYTSHCWFSSRLFCFPFISFIHGRHTALHFGRGGRGGRQRNKTLKVWELFPVPFFCFQEVLSVLTLLTQVFVHLWQWISGSVSSLCAKTSTGSYFYTRFLTENTSNPKLNSGKSFDFQSELYFLLCFDELIEHINVESEQMRMQILYLHRFMSLTFQSSSCFPLCKLFKRLMCFSACTRSNKSNSASLSTEKSNAFLKQHPVSASPVCFWLSVKTVQSL